LFREEEDLRHHPMTAWADHGADGNGEPMALVLRAGNAGSNTAADHIEAARLAIAQLPRQLRRRVLIRADSGGGTHGFLDWLTTKTGSPALPPTRRRASSLTWSCGTGGGPVRGPDSLREGHRAAEPSLKGFAQNQLWCEIVALACELIAWTQMLALAGAARRWEPKRLRLRVFAVAGRLASSGRRLRLRLAERWPWAGEITAAAACLQALPSG
jgi:hypothetical protein